MSQILPTNIDRLIQSRSVESARIEFKSGWDEHTSGPQAMRTLCAFANDYQNLHGGYLIFGVAERDGRPVLPPAGLTPAQMERAQQWLRGRCRALRMAR